LRCWIAGHRDIDTPLAVPPVALFFPRVTPVVIAIPFPEPRLVARRELDPPKPLRALPGVEPRDDEPRRRAMLRGERLAVRAKSDEAIVALRELDGRVRGEALFAVSDHVFCLR